MAIGAMLEKDWRDVLVESDTYTRLPGLVGVDRRQQECGSGEQRYYEKWLKPSVLHNFTSPYKVAAGLLPPTPCIEFDFRSLLRPAASAINERSSILQK